MGRVRYAKSLRDLEVDSEPAATEPLVERTRRSIRVVYETDAEVARAVVPKPLEARVQSEVCLTFTSEQIPVTPEYTREIRSACFGIRVEYDDKPGTYLITMPTSCESAVHKGREQFGEPRKLSEIHFDAFGGASESSVSASVERKGTRYLSAVGECVESLDARETTEIAYCFKAFPSSDRSKTFDQDPLLVRLEWRHRDDRVWRLNGGIELWDSPFDPVADLPMRQLIEFEYAEGTTECAGRVLRPVPGDWLLPFIHQRYDEPGVEGLDV